MVKLARANATGKEMVVKGKVVAAKAGEQANVITHISGTASQMAEELNALLAGFTV